MLRGTEAGPVLSDVGLRGNPLTDQLRDGDRHYRRVCIAFFFRRPTLRLDDAPVTLYERLSCRAALLKSNVLAAMDRSAGRSTDQPGVSPNAADRYALWRVVRAMASLCLLELFHVEILTVGVSSPNRWVCVCLERTMCVCMQRAACVWTSHMRVTLQDLQVSILPTKTATMCSLKIVFWLL